MQVVSPAGVLVFQEYKRTTLHETKNSPSKNTSSIKHHFWYGIRLPGKLASYRNFPMDGACAKKNSSTPRTIGEARKFSIQTHRTYGHLRVGRYVG